MTAFPAFRCPWCPAAYELEDDKRAHIWKMHEDAICDLVARFTPKLAPFFPPAPANLEPVVPADWTTRDDIALQLAVACAGGIESRRNDGPNRVEPESLAIRAYVLADAFLAYRARSPRPRR